VDVKLEGMWIVVREVAMTQYWHLARFAYNYALQQFDDKSREQKHLQVVQAPEFCTCALKNVGICSSSVFYVHHHLGISWCQLRLNTLQTPTKTLKCLNFDNFHVGNRLGVIVVYCGSESRHQELAGYVRSMALPILEAQSY